MLSFVNFSLLLITNWLLTDGPQFKTKPHSVQADLGASVTLSCDVDGNPLPDVTWFHEDNTRVVGNSPNLTRRVDASTAGRYFCKAHVPGFPDIGAEAAVYLKGRNRKLIIRRQGRPGSVNFTLGRGLVSSSSRPSICTWCLQFAGFACINYQACLSAAVLMSNAEWSDQLSSYVLRTTTLCV